MSYVTQQATGGAIGKSISKGMEQQLGLRLSNLFQHGGHRVPGMTHGDDFVVTGPAHRSQAQHCRGSQQTEKSSAVGQWKVTKQQNRRVHWQGKRSGAPARSRHIDVTDDEPEPLDQTKSSNHTSQVARCLFFGQDRADMTCTTPYSRAWQVEKRERQRRQLFNFERTGDEVTTQSVSETLQGNTKVIKCGRDTAWQSQVECIHM